MEVLERGGNDLPAFARIVGVGVFAARRGVLRQYDKGIHLASHIFQLTSLTDVRYGTNFTLNIFGHNLPVTRKVPSAGS